MDSSNFIQQTQIRVPDDRIGVIIGREGEIKQRIEQETGCKIKVSKDGTVSIMGNDAIGFIKAQNVIKAIARGFRPEIAFKLLKDDFKVLEIINLADYVNENAIKRIKGRIIGKDGKMRSNIEDTLDVNLSIYGKTVAIIGDMENVSAAREAIMLLIEGAQHSRVLRFMEAKKREIKARGMDWQPLT
ncbi:MAG: RNA-processing protein [Archaeoglobus sp.]|nr:RNA-processing protein [Archaeoglobus sp.]